MAANAETSVRLPDPRAAFDHLMDHLAEEGIEGEKSGPSSTRIRRMGCQVEFTYTADALKIDVSAPTKSMLYFLKEGATRHISEFDPIAGEAIRWSQDGDEASSPLNLHLLKLVRRGVVYPGMTRLTFTGDDLASLATGGIHIKLMVPAERSRTPVWPTVGANGVTQWPSGSDRLHVRYYTIRDFRQPENELDIDVVEHPGGRISDWAINAEPGEVIGVMGPGAGEMPNHPEALLLAGDETALPAISRILSKLDESAQGAVIVAYPEGRDAGEYLPANSLELVSLPPDRFRSEISGTIHSAGKMHRFKSAWFGGEFENAQALRRLFKQEFKLKKDDQLSVAYWRMGERGNADQ